MSEYIPDRWVVISIFGDDPHHRVFGSWVGGYLTGDSWRMNSGIVGVTEDNKFYHFNGHSGSVYHCRKGSYGFTSYGFGVLNRYIKLCDVDGMRTGIEVMKENTDWCSMWPKP